MTQLEITQVKLAKELLDAFATKTRDNGNVFYVFDDDKVTWTTAMELHGNDIMPNDWRYEVLCSLLTSLVNYKVEDWEDLDHEITGCAVDVYNHALLSWLTDYPDAIEAVDDALSSCDFKELIPAIQYAQQSEANTILYRLLDVIFTEAQFREREKTKLCSVYVQQT